MKSFQSDFSPSTFLSGLKWLPLSLPFLRISTPFNHSVSFLTFYYFCFSQPPPRALFLYFSALTGNGFACHVTLVTDCVMDGILVRALLCLRHTAGQQHPPPHTHHHHHLPLYLSCTAPCSRHPALLRIFSRRFTFSTQPCRGSPSICWLFYSRLALFVFLLWIWLRQTVNHCLILCSVIPLHICILSSFWHEVISLNNTVSSSKQVGCLVFRHRFFFFTFPIASPQFSNCLSTKTI